MPGMSASECTWHPAAARLAIAEAEVHLWRSRLDHPPGNMAEWADTLSQDEHARAARFHYSRDRARFIAGRGQLRSILARYLGTTPEFVAFTYSPAGKPALARPFDKAMLEFNVAHSHDLVLIAVACQRSVGVDVEFLRPLADAEQIATRFFTPAEQSMLLREPPEVRATMFMRLWVCKEAYLKALGRGIVEGLSDVEVLFPAQASSSLIVPTGESTVSSSWTLQLLSPAPGYVAGLAVQGTGWTLTCWQAAEN